MILKESLEVETSLESKRLIQLTVLRREGTNGRVVVSWQATATVDTSAISLQPNNGTVCLHHLLYFALVLTNQ